MIEIKKKSARLPRKEKKKFIAETCKSEFYTQKWAIEAGWLMRFIYCDKGYSFKVSIKSSLRKIAPFKGFLTVNTRIDEKAIQ